MPINKIYIYIQLTFGVTNILFLKIKILYDNIKVLFFATDPPLNPSNLPLLSNPPAKPFFRPGDTQTLPNMRSTCIAVPTQRQNQDRNAPRFQHLF